MKINNEESFLEIDFARDVKQGLSKNLKEIPCKYFYDQKGSNLFDLITEQEEYYLTRTEKQILEFQFSELEQLFSQIDEIVEFGPGDGSKAEIILRQFLRWRQLGFNYKAVDISFSAIKTSLSRLSKFQNLKLSYHIGDFSSFKFSTNHTGRLFLFLGSSIGNYEPNQAVNFLKEISLLMTSKDLLIIGFDKKKEISKLIAAYNDLAGIAREFNFNLIDRMNTELGANFVKSDFSHFGTYNPMIGAMQSFLVSEKVQKIYFKVLNESFHFDLGEAIHVENSFKYSDKDILDMAVSAGFSIVHNLEDEKKMFTDSVWKVKKFD